MPKFFDRLFHKRYLSRGTAILAAAAMLAAATPLAYAEYDLSPALSVIKSKVEVKKCGVKNTPIAFSETDFDPILGKAEYITLLTLPEKSAGALTVGNVSLAAGQTVTRRSLESMLFTPAADSILSTSFTFRDAAKENGSYGVCTLYVLESENGAPAPSDCNFETIENITYKGFLAASDPDGDAICYSIVSSAKHGTVRLCAKDTGVFMYTPRRDFTGRDIFSFRAVDCYGNRSAVMRVTVHVTEETDKTVFADMTNHWAHASAIRMAQAGIHFETMHDGKLFFEPTKNVGRGDFLAVAMIAAGYEDKVTAVMYTDFADDGDIPYNIKGYAAAAKKMGIVSGISAEDGTVRFCSAQPITRCEAALILSRLLIPETNWSSGESFSSRGVPTWASAPMETLADKGIMKGSGAEECDAESPVTRAQLSQIFCNVRKYRDGK